MPKKTKQKQKQTELTQLSIVSLQSSSTPQHYPAWYDPKILLHVGNNMSRD